MKMIEARVADQEKVDCFLDRNEAINGEQLLANGFVVEIGGRITGCYVVESVDKQTAWLKQLYMNQDDIFSLPLLIEAIIQREKQRGVMHIYVHSHQQVVDQLLSSLQFYPQKEAFHVHQGKKSGGMWWVYTI